MAKQVAIVMTEVFLRRLTPSLIPFVRRQHDFRILSIHRPIDELSAMLSKLKPSGLITEWLPDVTEALLELKLPTVIADTDMQYPGGVLRVWAIQRHIRASASRALSVSWVIPRRLRHMRNVLLMKCAIVRISSSRGRRFVRGWNRCPSQWECLRCMIHSAVFCVEPADKWAFVCLKRWQ